MQSENKMCTIHYLCLFLVLSERMFMGTYDWVGNLLLFKAMIYYLLCFQSWCNWMCNENCAVKFTILVCLFPKMFLGENPPPPLPEAPLVAVSLARSLRTGQGLVWENLPGLLSVTSPALYPGDHQSILMG